MFKKFIAVIMLSLAPMMSSADTNGTEDEALKMIDSAIAYYEENGLEKFIEAVEDTSNMTFHDRDLYVFVGEIDGNFVAHGVNSALVGRDLDGLKDADGKPFIMMMKEIAREEGKGWVSYKWTNPTNGNIDPKKTHIVTLGADMYLAVGIYDK